MEKIRRYDFDGVILDVPLRYDQRSGVYIEEYPDFTQTPLWTGKGYPIMFAGEDACPQGESEEPDGCPDCGSCRHYRRAAEHSWIGECRHQTRRRSGLRQNE